MCIRDRHKAGYDLFGNPGGEFFEGEGAAGIRLAQSMADDPGLIAAADASESPGNGRNALAMAQLKDCLLYTSARRFTAPCTPCPQCLIFGRKRSKMFAPVSRREDTRLAAKMLQARSLPGL